MKALGFLLNGENQGKFYPTCHKIDLLDTLWTASRLRFGFCILSKPAWLRGQLDLFAESAPSRLMALAESRRQPPVSQMQKLQNRNLPFKIRPLKSYESNVAVDSPRISVFFKFKRLLRAKC